MNGLMLHCGAHTATLDQVFSAPLPERTETHTPVAHQFVVETAIQILSDYGFTVNEQAHALSHEGMRYFGLLNVGSQRDDFSQVVGLRNSNDKRFPVGLSMGSRVFVCDNLAFSGEVSLKRKHTSGIFGDIKAKMIDTIAQLKGFFTNQERRFDQYKDFKLTTPEASQLILKACEHGAIPKTNIMDVWTEFTNPTHEDFRECNLWSLYNAFTEIHKKRPSLVELPKRTMRMQTLFDRVSTFDSQFQGMEIADNEVEVVTV